MGTESAQLLVKEHHLMKQLIARIALPQRRKDPQEKSRQALLEQRDAFIAQRINATLQAGSWASSFWGCSLLENRLDPDIG